MSQLIVPANSEKATEPIDIAISDLDRTLGLFQAALDLAPENPDVAAYHQAMRPLLEFARDQVERQKAFYQQQRELMRLHQFRVATKPPTFI